MKHQFFTQRISRWALSVVLVATLVYGSPSCKKGGNDNNNGGGTTPTTPTTKTFTNPLLSSGPDPFVAQKDTMYYYTHTMGDRITLWRTNAMSRLSTAPFTTVFTPPASGPNSRDVWAPELHFLNGKWYIYYTAGNGTSATNDPFTSQRTFVLENSSADPTTGTWVDKGRIYDAANDYWAIDGTVFELNGSLYFLWSGRAGAANDKQNIYIAPMSNPWTISGPRTMLTTPQYSWEMQGTPAVNEGPEILKNSAGKVFLIYSASGCWTDDYGMGMLTLKDGGNPLVATDWTKSSTPVFQKAPSNNVYGPGHNSFFVSRDGKENWIVYHANAAPMNGNGCGNTRSPRMQKFTWNTDGSPSFGTPAATGAALTVPGGE